MRRADVGAPCLQMTYETPSSGNVDNRVSQALATVLIMLLTTRMPSRMLFGSLEHSTSIRRNNT
jgi:hypothetical protein